MSDEADAPPKAPSLRDAPARAHARTGDGRMGCAAANPSCARVWARDLVAQGERRELDQRGSLFVARFSPRDVGDFERTPFSRDYYLGARIAFAAMMQD